MPDDAAEFVQLITADGSRPSTSLFEAWVTDIDDAQLVARYEDMVVVRRIDVEATALQRQGQLALWPPLLGQEAAQVGSARALEDKDFVFASYRENGVAYCRGIPAVDLLKVWRGTSQSGWNPYDFGMATPQIIIGAQTLHATGYALGMQNDRSDVVSVTYFGDGATSEGDVSEAMVFASTFKAPVVFFCQNNHWAISEPVGLQSKEQLVNRAAGFGMPGVRVDGNDVLAVLAVTREALERARRGDGPTFIEAVTYRMGPHTTADDPTRYREPAELAEWAQRDPIARLGAYLRSTGALTDEVAGTIDETADRVAAELRAGCLALPDPEPLSLFEHVYSEPHRGLDRQRDHYARYLAMFETAPTRPAVQS
ncbi:pyruvate dehydrogenase (acetyl-transferring) E1 component subunit alpha [Salinibacterium sp. G-O1]|uniref:pyruvate dehydrogenase (acetyl-transferring) E1 component subunit alpha n=1 Tax=Salinibacterium sp. G-O1 TaxID=3046208 RepID=UPI0024BA90CF|nr:pyruvate dehydrogenase (acetyl-transferring) E1 component subunit alpha [Salinibacterium sp. G-O1]MDJ0333868.1 pyruvate dehydrogenase (acetyl-transferring) E1 component subunit alpha [Salinibacterium sp. G-O1]